MVNCEAAECKTTGVYSNQLEITLVIRTYIETWMYQKYPEELNDVHVHVSKWKTTQFRMMLNLFVNVLSGIHDVHTL